MKKTRDIQVLLVEDDPVHARLIRRALDTHTDAEHVPVQIEHLADGETALDRVLGPQRAGAEPEAGRPDLILLDLRLPTIDGFDVLEAVRSCASTRQVPIVIVSTSDHETDVDRCYRLGANAYVTKPPDFEELTGKMARLSQFWMHAAELPIHS